MPKADTSRDLLSRYRGGDDEAAGIIFDRYVGQLVSYAQQRLSDKLARRVDPEDIVQSAYRSFFRLAQDEKVVLRRSGDLWRLLSAITLNKLRGQVERHSAQRRDFRRDQALPDESPHATGGQLVEDAAALVEQVERMMVELKPKQRRVLELRLQGHSLDEISRVVGRAERTIRRWLDDVRHRLEQILREPS